MQTPSRLPRCLTATGLQRIHDIGDTYEPGMEMWHGYQRSVACVGENSIDEGFTNDELNVDFEALCENPSFG